MSAGAITHIAGLVVHLDDNRLRQRCAWCGAILIDEDLSRVRVMAEHPAYPTFEVGALITVDGNASWRAGALEGGRLPDVACGRLDPEVTV